MATRNLLLLFAAAGVACVGFAKPKVVVVNEDNDHYFKLDASLMNEESLKAYIDKLAGGKVTHFFMCPSGQRPSYGSKVWDPIWADYDPAKHAKNRHFRDWATNAKALHDKGVDPYQVWIRRCRERGISPWLSPRMNDCHNANERNPWRSTRFWREHEELHCEPGYRGMDWNRATLNFALDPVQDYTFALVKEQLDRYDIDGYELDFFRFHDHFPRAVAAQSSRHLDRFVKRVRAYMEKTAAARGHPILLGVRVATTPAAARAKGCDVGKWVREGWVDWVCGSTYWETPDYNFPAKEWREWFGPRADEVTLLAGTDHGVNSAWNGGVRLDMEMKYYAGFADVQWGNGADGVYLFNLPYLDRELAEVCRLGLFPGDLPAQRRAYPVSFRSEAWGGVSDDLQLPRRTDRPTTLRVRLGERPVGKVSVVVGVKEPGVFAPEVTLNGARPFGSSPEVMRIRPTGIAHKGVDYTCRRYHFPASSVHGGADNVVAIAPTAEAKTILWCEIDLDPADFVLGADVSWTTLMERNGGTFRTADGRPSEPFALMRDYGLDAVRLRVWVDPTDGMCGLTDTLAKARRAVAAGLDVMVDFHYSDSWADPGVQQIPKAWEGHDADRLCRDIAAHTTEVLEALKRGGVAPKWVQVGNETTYGFLWNPKRDERGKTKWVNLGDELGWEPEMAFQMGSRTASPRNYARFFKAGYDAVKAVFPSAAVIVHLTNAEDEKALDRNLETLARHGAKWDMVGLSVYAKDSTSAEVGGDAAKYRQVNAAQIEAVVANIVKGAAKWKCPYMIVETGVETCPRAPVDQAATREVMAQIMHAARTRTGGACKGAFYWEPECTPKMYPKGAFESDGRPTEIMDAFAH